MTLINKQIPEKYIKISKDNTLDIHSIFHTIQGEGVFCGTPSVFIRLAGCNLQCPKCDTDYTEGRKLLPVSQILDIVSKLSINGLVVITGGEPFRQGNLCKLIKKLTDKGYYVQIETNGTLPIPSEINNIENVVTNRLSDRVGNVYIVCSPKTGSVHKSVVNNACCFKYVGGHKDLSVVDGLPNTALDHTAKPVLFRPSINSIVYLQPLDEKDDVENKLNLEACIDSCLKYGYILQLQTHKIIGVE